ncbi:MAG: ATP-dependent metallopeptidase FtsH/Yme1/Tma family protein [Deltaproteobacteria bacterium]|nr:ATP-dependent metallopeptidase FtsH/Yme1/Tma family protein [Deltaproteobacteria bacterium]
MNKLKKPLQFNVTYAILTVFILSLFWNLLSSHSLIRNVPYSEFLSMLEHGQIREVLLTEHEMTGLIKAKEGETSSYVKTNRVDQDTAALLKQYGVSFSGKSENTFFQNILSWLGPVVIFFLIWGFFARKMFDKGGLHGGFMSVGKSKAKIYVESNTKTTFQDVAGSDEAKEELAELVDFLRGPEKYRKLGSRMPKGILLVGPPGTGKTLIAKAVAGEASVPFFSTNGAEFVEMFVGVGAARVRDLFDQARQKSPCIIFIDEIDALGKVRMAGPHGHGNDEKEQTLNQLLAELDGFDSASGIILLAATNRPEILDPALLRSGRFDRQVLIDRPDKRGRQAILKLHCKKTKLDDHVSYEKIAALTSGFTGADLENLVNEATLIATRKNAESVCEDDFVQAMERIIAGPEKKNRLMNSFERQVVACHEMGHAIVAHAVKENNEAVHKVSIIPRGIGALGYTIRRPTEDRYLMTRDELMSKMTVLMGGRSAESLIFGHKSTGAADDLAKATDIAWSIVTKYGMSDEIGHMVCERDSSPFSSGDILSSASGSYRSYSNETAYHIDSTVRKLLDMAAEESETLLKANLSLLKESSALLLDRETLAETDLAALMRKVVRKTENKL